MVYKYRREVICLILFRRAKSSNLNLEGIFILCYVFIFLLVETINAVWQSQCQAGQKVQPQTTNYYKVATPLDSGELHSSTPSQNMLPLWESVTNFVPVSSISAQTLPLKPNKALKKSVLLTVPLAAHAVPSCLYRLWRSLFWMALKTRQSNPGS